MVKAVIFDMDNLMIDSEELHFEAYKETLLPFNISLSKEEYDASVLGRADRDACAAFVAMFFLQVSPKELLHIKNGIFRSKFIHEVIIKEGLLELLHKLKDDGYPMAVASGSQLEEIEMIVKNLKLEDYFKAVISVDAVRHGKPAPDIFLLAAEKLEVDPMDCLVLEDAPSGVKAAKAAGMKCFVIPSEGVKEGDIAAADKILSSLKEVYPLLAQKG